MNTITKATLATVVFLAGCVLEPLEAPKGPGEQCFSSFDCAPDGTSNFAVTYCCAGPAGQAGTCQAPVAGRLECRP